MIQINRSRFKQWFESLNPVSIKFRTGTYKDYKWIRVDDDIFPEFDDDNIVYAVFKFEKDGKELIMRYAIPLRELSQEKIIQGLVSVVLKT